MLEQMAVETMNIDCSQQERDLDHFKLKRTIVDVEVEDFSDEIELDLEEGVELELESLTLEKRDENLFEPEDIASLESLKQSEYSYFNVDLSTEKNNFLPNLDKTQVEELDHSSMEVVKDEVYEGIAPVSKLVEEIVKDESLFTKTFITEENLDVEVEILESSESETILYDDFRIESEIEDYSDVNKEVNLETCGLIYRLDGGVTTFSVKGVCVDNISQALIELENVDSELWKPLKTQERDVNSLFIFITKTRALAEVISDELLNRRFPVKEDMVCNISDPGFSWWMVDNGSGFNLFFKSFGTDRADRYTRLGPLGDSSIAQKRFSQAEPLFRTFFPVNEFATSDNFFSISSVKENHLSFQIFKDIFVSGVNNTTLEDFPDTSVGRTLFFYFQEMSALREFWLDIESKIG